MVYYDHVKIYLGEVLIITALVMLCEHVPFSSELLIKLINYLFSSHHNDRVLEQLLSINIFIRFSICLKMSAIIIHANSCLSILYTLFTNSQQPSVDLVLVI